MSTSPDRSTNRTLLLTGLLDGVSGAHLSQTVTALVASGVRTVVLDCRDVTFMDSTGLSRLLDCHKTLQQVGGQLFLSDLNESVHGLLLLTGLDAVLTLL